jgi:hypothetical protein
MSFFCMSMNVRWGFLGTLHIIYAAGPRKVSDLLKGRHAGQYEQCSSFFYWLWSSMVWECCQADLHCWSFASSGYWGPFLVFYCSTVASVDGLDQWLADGPRVPPLNSDCARNLSQHWIPISGRKIVVRNSDTHGRYSEGVHRIRHERSNYHKDQII